MGWGPARAKKFFTESFAYRLECGLQNTKRFSLEEVRKLVVNEREGTDKFVSL